MKTFKELQEQKSRLHKGSKRPIKLKSNQVLVYDGDTGLNIVDIDKQTVWWDINEGQYTDSDPADMHDPELEADDYNNFIPVKNMPLLQNF